MRTEQVDGVAAGAAPVGRGMGWLNVTQFLGALNDNVFKLLVVFALVRILGEARRAWVLAASATAFVLPFILFSQAAGVLADRLSKRRVIVASKVAEIAIMGLGWWAVTQGTAAGCLAVIFLMSAQSAVFGPAKYGIVPELAAPAELSRANARLTLWTYLAVIGGSFLPAFLLERVAPGSVATVAGVCVLLAAAGALTALRIPRTPPAGGRGRLSLWFLGDVARTLKRIAPDRQLTAAVWGAAYFLCVAAFVQQSLLIYGQDELGLSLVRAGYLFPLTALGIGMGALWSARLSGRMIEFGVVPFGALLLAGACAGLAWATPVRPVAHALIVLIGVGIGLFIVPLNAFVQQRSAPTERGRVLAAESLLSFAGVALAAGVFYLANGVAKWGGRACFALAAAMTTVLAAFAFRRLPDFVVRLLCMLIARGLYRVRVHGLANVPASGPALLVPNHVTWADALLVNARIPRRIRFVMAREVYEKHWSRPILKLMRVIPISPADPPRRALEALRQAREALLEGYLVCIFAEGALTRNGNVAPFRSGFERIVRGLDVPVIPVCIAGAWGSIFSHARGLPGLHWPRRWPYPVRLLYGAPLASTTTAAQARQAVLELQTEAFEHERRPDRTLAHRSVRMARRRWWRLAVADTTGARLSFGRLLTAAIAVADALRRRGRADARVGVLLPASVGAAVANMAITTAGRTVVNLNFTIGPEALAAAVRKAGLNTILTSRAFLERFPALASLPGLLPLEELRREIGPARRACALIKAACWPVRALARGGRLGPDETAVILFSSGSTGDAKGVVLSHHNIVSNIESFTQVFRFGARDGMTGILPFFHSFGYTCTLWTPLLCGFRAVYHPNPLDAGRIGEMVRRDRLTCLLATPTFLGGYVKRVPPADFATLRVAICGAEKLRPAVAQACRERFGLTPLEGYGATELAPVASLNVPDVTTRGMTHVGHKPGSIGQPVPGVVARVTDPEAGRPLPPGAEGMLEIRGPNVMCGYLDAPAETARVLRQGWYVTGDLARMDEDGFVHLLGRYSRFSKIGGEMVPHGLIEERLLAKLGAELPVLFVGAAPDERRGEQLVVLYTPEAGDPERLRGLARELDLPNLWRPRPEHFYPIPNLPTLGSGKLDLKRLQALAVACVTTNDGRP